MRYLHYTNYQSGRSGLSNAIMSIEVGVILAFLTKRFLVLDGNRTPPANVVDYGGRVDNARPSRVTDLLDLPVPWADPDDVDLSGIQPREWSDEHLFDSVYHVAGTVDLESDDAHAFANGRTTWLTETDELHESELLRLSEDPVVQRGTRHRTNLSFYSYLFYLDPANRRAVYRLLEDLRAKAPYAELARQVVDGLGAFNAVHLRRGDFKVTYGVTTLERQPWEVVEALDHHFERTSPLVICTDERRDPFFDEITAAYPAHVFIDEYILDHHGAAFRALPQHDSIALAFLSQLVASHSRDFIGTMTSTFTSIIQRYRGNNGLDEPFKFLWNELPDPGVAIERGRHPVGNCVPMERCLMVPEYEGPYSWNRYSALINGAWMREWPESFLTPQVLETGLLETAAPNVGAEPGSPGSTYRFSFDGIGIEIRSEVAGVLRRVVELFGGDRPREVRNLVIRYEITVGDKGLALAAAGEPLGFAETADDLLQALVDDLVPRLAHGRVNHSWVRGVALEQGGNAILFVGDGQDSQMTIADALGEAGWTRLGDHLVPIRRDSLRLTPFLCSSGGLGHGAEPDGPRLRAIVFAARRLHGIDGMAPLAPSVALARAIGWSEDFRLRCLHALKRLTALVESLPCYTVVYSEPDRIARSIGALAEAPRDSTQSSEATP